MISQSLLGFGKFSLIVLVVFVAMLSTVKGFSFNGMRRGSSLSRLHSLQMANNFHLVLVRHGESTWNDENKFTGWYDCPLSKKGEAEAIAAGKLLKENNFKFDLAYTSYLQRAIKTLWHSLEQTGHMYIPVNHAWQLNER